MKRLRKPSVILQVRNGPSIEGVLLGRCQNEYVIAAAKVYRGADEAADVGEVRVRHDQTLFYQVLR